MSVDCGGFLFVKIRLSKEKSSPDTELLKDYQYFIRL